LCQAPENVPSVPVRLSRFVDPPHVLSLKESRYSFTFPYVFGRDGLED
jgi:hypothetical protein